MLLSDSAGCTNCTAPSWIARCRAQARTSSLSTYARRAYRRRGTQAQPPARTVCKGRYPPFVFSVLLRHSCAGAHRGRYSSLVSFNLHRHSREGGDPDHAAGFPGSRITSGMTTREGRSGPDRLVLIVFWYEHPTAPAPHVMRGSLAMTANLCLALPVTTVRWSTKPTSVAPRCLS